MYLFSFLSISNTLYLVYWSCDHFYIHCTYIWFIYIDVCSFTYLSMCCFFSFFIQMFFYKLYAIYYFCFTLRCLDEFCLKCFRNTGYQSLLAINSLLAKFFKSLC